MAAKPVCAFLSPQSVATSVVPGLAATGLVGRRVARHHRRSQRADGHRDQRGDPGDDEDIPDHGHSALLLLLRLDA